MDKAISMFLYNYKSIEHSTTKRSPAFLMFKHVLRFDLLRPNVNESVEDSQRAQIIAKNGERNVKLEAGDKVLIDDFGARGNKRIEGEIIENVMPSTSIVKDKNEVLQKRHIDQMYKRKDQSVPRRRSPRLYKTYL